MATCVQCHVPFTGRDHVVPPEVKFILAQCVLNPYCISPGRSLLNVYTRNLHPALHGNGYTIKPCGALAKWSAEGLIKGCFTKALLFHSP